MPLPLSILLYDRGANGVPTTSNPVNLAGIVDSYEDTIDDRYGFATARVSWTPSRNDILEWARADHLLRPMVAYSPDARIVWEGFLADIEISLGTKKLAFSLKDMANRLTVRYSTPAGAQGDSTVYSSTASQALFGIKDRVINASIASSTAASNQAQTILGILAFPRSKQASSAGTPRGDLKITLTFSGRYALLDWLVTASTTTTSTSTSTQIGSLLAAYAAVNNFFSTATTGIVSTGVTDTEYMEPDTTYREKIERLLARGNSSQQPLAWGFYEGGVFSVAVRASATPTTITYYESEASGDIRDAYGNVVDPWDVRPNAMALVTDLIDSALAGAVESPLRKYVSRVARRISGNDISVSLEPEDTDNLESLLTAPAGGGPSGTSDRQAAFERKVVAPARSVLAGLDNATRYNRSTGVWEPVAGGTGIANVGKLTVPTDSTISTGGGTISTGGGSISTGGGSIDTGGGTVGNTGGGAVDLGTGSGIGGVGSSGVSTAGGTTGRIAEWASTSALTASTMIKSGAGVLTLSAGSAYTLTVPATGTAALGSGTAASLAKWSATNTLTAAVAGTDFAAGTHTHPTADIVSGTMATARLGSGTASSSTFLRGDSTWAAPTAALVGAAPDDAKYIVQTASSGLSAEQALGSLATGLVKNTTTTGVLSIATAADLPDHASRHENGGADEVALDASQITSGTMATARLGSGTANSSSYLRGDSTWQALTAATVSAAPNDAKYIVQTADADLTAEQALSSLATGILKNTTSTGVLSIAAASDLPTHASRHNDGGADEVALNASQITAGTMATARLGSGTANSTTFLRGDQTWAAPSSGSVDGSGASTRVAYWSDTDTLTSDSAFTWDATNNRLTIGEIITSAGQRWDLGAGTSGAVTCTAHIRVTIAGAAYDILAYDGS